MIKFKWDHLQLRSPDPELKKRGVVFTQEPKTLRPGVRGCFIRGPQNIAIEILERDLP